MKKRLLLLLFLSLPSFASSPEDCPSFDFTARFGPTQDQGMHGLCWAFTAAGLLEEQACLQKPSLCGQALSALDVSRCQWTVGLKEEGADERTAVQCALDDGGICPDIDAPFYADFTPVCLARTFSTLNASYVTSCFTQELLDFYRFWKKQISPLEIDEYHQSPLEENRQFPKIMNLLSQFQTLTAERDAQGFDIRVDPLNALNEAADERDFIKMVLLPKSCRENRIQFHGSTQGKEDYNLDRINHHPEENSKYWHAQVLEAFRQNRSVGIAFCTEKAGFFNDLGRFFGIGKNSKECGAHALIANGMRWNASSKTCELHLKNSLGEGAAYNDWIDAHEILKATFSTTYIK